MELQKRERLPGMRDLVEEESRRLRQAQDMLQDVLTLHNYRLVDTPILEPTQIFLRKSGGELASRMYAFTEPGGHQVSLRPEFTSAVIRLFLEGHGSASLPVRWQYAGPVFRYTGGDTSSARQFTQVGAEFIGADGPMADAEVMALACRALGSLGLERIRLVVGNVGTVQRLLHQFQISERAILFLIRSTGTLTGGAGGLEAVREQGISLGLFQAQGHGGELDPLAAYLAAQESDHLAQQLTPATIEAPIGVRTPEEIAARLQRKLHEVDSAEQLERALGFTHDLAQLRGAPGPTLEAARALVARYSLDPDALGLVQEDLECLEDQELKGVEVTVDLGLVRDIAYYTGLVFEVRDEPAGDGVFLAGGGRYDGLVRALGGAADTPALGFACTLESALDAVARHPATLPPPRLTKRALVAPRHKGLNRQALRVAAALRLGGEAAEVALSTGSLQSHLEDARRRGIQAVLVVEEDGTSERHWVQDR